MAIVLTLDVVVHGSSGILAFLGFAGATAQLLFLGAATSLLFGLEAYFEYSQRRLWRSLAQTLQHRLRAASSYEILADGSLDLVSASVENGQTASCWLVSTGSYAYTTNNLSDTVSGYVIDQDGGLSLLDADGVAGLTGHAPVDAALTPDGRFLYNVNAGAGTVTMFQIETDGSLISLGEIDGLPEEGAVAIAAR